ncbi:MAG: hypothetical protein ACE5JG_09040 [Planctomycetota bacterium]
MSKTGFVSGLLGVAVGVLLAALFGIVPKDTEPQRPADVSRLERAVGRLESALGAWREEIESRAPIRAGAGTPPSATPDVPDAAPRERERPRPHAGVQGVVERSRALRRYAGSRTDEKALRSLTLDPSWIMANYALWSRSEILEHFGKPSSVGIRGGHPAFLYSFKDDDARTRYVSFTFVDGLLFHVGVS